METTNREIGRVLIYRLGSLGDTVVALPCFHLIARSFPNAERRLLTNLPVDPRAPSAASVLTGSDLVATYLSYPVGLRRIRALSGLSADIRRWCPDALVYLTEPRGAKAIFRDAAFFRASGIKKMIGIPWRKRDRIPRKIGNSGYYELEAARLARCISALGDAAVEDPASWDLHIADSEREQGGALLTSWSGRIQFVACGLGAKVEVKDWGMEKWRYLLGLVSRKRPNVGLLLVGAREEASVSAEAADWRGPVLNLCGLTSPRQTAALLQEAELYVGHDSGPMHLAAAMGTRCVAVFSARSLPGVWFPAGRGHRVIYHRVSCAGCGLERCFRHAKTCINSVTVEEVYRAVSAALDESWTGKTESQSAEALAQ
jgi:heptosyltransferase III